MTPEERAIQEKRAALAEIGRRERAIQGKRAALAKKREERARPEARSEWRWLRRAAGGGALLGGLAGGIFLSYGTGQGEFLSAGDWGFIGTVIGVVIGAIAGFLLWATWVLLVRPLARLLSRAPGK